MSIELASETFCPAQPISYFQDCRWTQPCSWGSQRSPMENPLKPFSSAQRLSAANWTPSSQSSSGSKRGLTGRALRDQAASTRACQPCLGVATGATTIQALSAIVCPLDIRRSPRKASW